MGTDTGGGSLDARYPTTITFDFLRMDSWDNELFKLRLEGDPGQWNEGSKRFTGDTREDSFDLMNLSNGFRVTFTPVAFGSLMNHGSGWNDQTFTVTATLPKGYTSYKLYFDGQTDQDHGDEAYGIDNFVVRQNRGEPYAELNDGGEWNDLPPSSTRPGIAEIVVPNLVNSARTSL
jgi:hypothetical protein